MTTPPVALTIAGSDSSGGAGIQADLATFAAHGVHGTSAITALTAQNTAGVHGIAVTDCDFLTAQLDAVLSDLPVAATKTGMLATEEIVRLVADLARAGRLPQLVVDPVMVASTGARLLTAGAEGAYRDALLPEALIITPNLREATVLLGLNTPLRRSSDVLMYASDLQALCPRGYVVITGGHVRDDEAVDVVLHHSGVDELAGPWVETDNDHGTGCTFAAATAARLALGDDPLDAIIGAKGYVSRQIARSAKWQLGAGRGPVAHVRE